MAAAGDSSRALIPSRAASAAPPRLRRQKWEVEYARYFATPQRDPSTPPPPGLRNIIRGKLRHQGTWLPAASPALLCVSRPGLPFAVPILTVSIGDVAFEEHFMSILNFSWPQVTCVTQCPIRGSRVVFVSFCDKSKQIQKFAVRFPQLSDAESFLNCVKECSSKTMDIIPSGSDYMCEDSSATEYIASKGLHHRPDDASSFEEPASDHVTEAPALSYHKEPERPVLEPLLARNIDNIYSGFPPSFTHMLTNCSTESEKEEPYPVTTNHASQEVYAVDTSHDIAVATKETTAEKGRDTGEGIDASKVTGDIMARIKTYMTDESFHGYGHDRQNLMCWCNRSTISGSACYGAAAGAERGIWSVAHQPGERTQVFNCQQGYGTYCLLLGCGESMNVSLPFRGGHGRAKRATVPALAGDCSARRRRVLASPIRPCILLRAGELCDDSESMESPESCVLA
ncbi:protein POOR HOMOLOGOUS SYNAPSIS 1 isoform X3 [Phragmites australis]|uniref:protein POOR HOMOLOGOUS SYNAPSIS 1 isoform X3 n=1 Tax=Phragmites australis TaxID=29695 RepID=UPI002D78CAE1|nr:protein POOR HOMOLOGOUS SYNAPSIS 1 isoform X3 [Phragmites australis]